MSEIKLDSIINKFIVIQGTSFYTTDYETFDCVSINVFDKAPGLPFEEFTIEDIKNLHRISTYRQVNVKAIELEEIGLLINLGFKFADFKKEFCITVLKVVK